MLINEIGDKKLKKPLEVTITKQYTATNEEIKEAIIGVCPTKEG